MACLHCGLPTAAGAAFCCAGCEAVSGAIRGEGLESFYRLRDPAPSAPPPAEIEDLPLYDEASVQARFVRAGDGATREADLVIEGLRCAACAWLVEQVLAKAPGVTRVDVNYATRRARLAWDVRAAKLSDLLRAVARVGYRAWPYEEKRLSAIGAGERRDLLKRLAVAALGMMQVMMYAIPAYVASDGEITPDIESLMRWAGLWLTFPVVAYSAAPFFRGAWRDLALRRLGMDVPVALGIAIAFAASVWTTLAGSGPVYFDSVAMFVFLLTGGRYLELHARSRAADSLAHLSRLKPNAAHRLRGSAASDFETVPATLLAPGDRALVLPGETLPADGTLEAGTAEIAEALLTGESKPLRRTAGEALVGGATNAGSAFVMRVTRAGEQATISLIERLTQGALAMRPRWVESARRASAVFVAAILAAAVAAGLVWIEIDSSRALWIAVSVLIVTCPCALSLATPVANTVAVGEAGRHGLVITRADAIEAMAGATDVVFDKTGTLTVGRPHVLRVVPLGYANRDECIADAAAIGRLSAHPLDRALVEAAGDLPLPAASAPRNFPGAGIEAQVRGRAMRIGRPDFVAALHGTPLPADPGGEGSGIWLGDANGWIAMFRIGDAIRPEAKRAIDRLRARGLTIHLLTGDEESAASSVARSLGIERVEARATPRRKLSYVKAMQLAGARVAMVGDGINDAPVLAQADVSIAMGGGADLAQVRADAVLISESLDDLAAAFERARRARRVIRQNLGWALGYNLIAVPLAFAGWVTPLAAGIGMSASSLAVVANALRLRR